MHHISITQPPEALSFLPLRIIPDFDRRPIRFDYITKKSPDHKKAYAVHTGKEEAYKIAAEELLKLL